MAYFAKLSSLFLLQLLINLQLLSTKASQCPTGYISCYSSKNASLLGCCDTIAGVCCKDDIHCCPENYACSDLHAGCERLKNVEMVPIQGAQLHSPNDIVCKDGKTKCPDFTTCCPLPPGGYGCCNYTNGNCCPDMVHCCPKGYDCAEGTSKCKRQSQYFSAHIILQKTVLCDDNKTMCDNEKKCCKQRNGTYACCPSGSPVCCTAFCCPDDSPICCGKYCCKECDTVNMKCIEDQKIPYITMEKIKIKAIVLQKPKRLSDSEGLGCTVFQKSCKTGCCPEEYGTCCSNKQYCCPKHYTCTSDNKCVMI